MKNQTLPVPGCCLVVPGRMHATKYTIGKSSSAKQTWEYKQLLITRRVGAEKSNRLQYAESPTWTEDDKEIPDPVNMVSKAKELGDQGWELVSVTAIPGIAASGGSYAGFADVVEYWFKRPISAPDKQTR